MDSSNEPLISSRDESLNRPNESLEYDADDATDLASSIGSSRPQPESPPGVFILLLTFAAGISGLLFGYDTGVISSTLVSIGTSLSNHELTSTDKSIITSSTALFALLVSPFSSLLADALGRRRVILLADLLFTIGALIQAISHTVTLMVLGRCIIGAAVGSASFVVPLYIAEIAPATHRGRLVTTNVLFITLGQMVAYITGWLLSTYGSPTTAWRWMVGLGAAPAVVQAVIVLFMPETPRWLVKMGRTQEAKLVVQRVSGGKDGDTRAAEMVVRDIEIEARAEEEERRLRRGPEAGMGRWLGPAQELFKEGRNRRALAIACLLQGLQQLCGFNSLMYFSATIFTLVGFSSPTLTSLTVACTNFIFTLLALFLIDRIGRRRILLSSIPFMVIGLLLAALGFYLMPMALHPSDTDTNDSSSSSSAVGSPASAGIILASIMLYVAAYALGLGNVPWMQSELFPLAVRSWGSGIATATNWGCNFIIGLTFLPMMDILSPTWTFILYAMICCIGLAIVAKIYPETAGLTLEESTALLDNGWGVK